MNTKIIKTNSMNEMETTKNAAMIWDYTYDQDFKVGFTNEKGDLIIPHKYNECLYINKGIALVTVNGKCRMINSKDETICEYDTIHPDFTTQVGDKFGLISCRGELICEPKYDKVNPSFDNDMFAVGLGDKWAIAVEQERLVTPFKYDNVKSLGFNNMAGVCIGNKWGFVDREGREVTDFIYDNLTSFHSVWKVYINDRWGLVGEAGKELCQIKYDNIADTDYNADKDTPILVKYYDRYGFINIRGEEVIPLRYDYAYAFVGDRAVVRVGGLWGIINQNGEFVVEPQYDVAHFSASNEWESHIIVAKDDKWGLIDWQGNILCELMYDNIQQYFDYYYKKYFFIKLGGKEGLISNSGNTLLPPIYDEIIIDNPEYIRLRIGDKWGFTHNFTYTSEIKYDDVEADACGLVTVRIGDKWGLNHISRYAPNWEYSCNLEDDGKIKEVLECKYEDINKKFNYVALLLDNKWSYINVSLNDGSVRVLCDHKYDYMLCTSKGFAIVMRDNKWGHINSEGKEIYGLKYDDAYGFVQQMEYNPSGSRFYNLNIAGVCLNGKWGFINEQGELICDLKFDSVAIWHSDMDGYSYEAYLGKKIYTLSRAGEFVERR